MRPSIAAALIALGLSSPALATGGFECRPLKGSGPVLNLVVGHTISPRPLSVTIQDGQTRLSTHGPGAQLAIGQSWIDGRHLWLDVADPHATRFEARLRARFNGKLRGRPAIGTLTRNNRTWRVRCDEA